jgi:hypothetical protein
MLKGILHNGITEQIHVGLELNDTESLSEFMVLALLHEGGKNLCSTETWSRGLVVKKNGKKGESPWKHPRGVLPK